MAKLNNNVWSIHLFSLLILCRLYMAGDRDNDQLRCVDHVPSRQWPVVKMKEWLLIWASICFYSQNKQVNTIWLIKYTDTDEVGLGRIVETVRHEGASDCSISSPDAVPVIPADEGPEWAALTPVTVGAHQAICTSPIPSKLAPTHLTRPLQTHPLPTTVHGSAVCAVQGAGIRLVLGTGRG